MAVVAIPLDVPETDVSRTKRTASEWHSPPEGVWEKKLVWKEEFKKIWVKKKKLVWQVEWKKHKEPKWITEKVSKIEEKQVPAWKIVKKPIIKEIKVLYNKTLFQICRA